MISVEIGFLRKFFQQFSLLFEKTSPLAPPLRAQSCPYYTAKREVGERPNPLAVVFGVLQLLYGLLE